MHVISLSCPNPLLATQSRILKICIFATGCAGIVAEFVLSTLASYLLGNPILQWTVLMSLMLFAMGLGCRISKYILHNLLDKFIFLEFSLSILCGISVALCYWASTFSQKYRPAYILIQYINWPADWRGNTFSNQDE